MSTSNYTVSIDGQKYEVPYGKSLLSLLIENNIFQLKKNLVTNELRFGICGMGTCFECEVHIEKLGIRRACLISIDSDLEVKTGATSE